MKKEWFTPQITEISVRVTQGKNGGTGDSSFPAPSPIDGSQLGPDEPCCCS